MNAMLGAIGLGELSFSAGTWLWAVPLAALPLLFRRSAAPGRPGPHLRGPVHSNHRWRAGLESLALAALLLALSGPRLPGGSVQVVRYGSDVVFVLDVSRSMLATDIKPSRLERAKTEIRLLVEQLGNHRLGLVAFAGTAVTFPLTLDRQAVNLFLRDLSVLDIPVQGTAIALALKRAKETLAGARGTGAQAASIVLVTDGEDHAGNLAQAAADLKAAGIIVHVRALGSESAVPVPAIDEDGNVVGTHRDRRGRAAETRYTQEGEEALRKLADQTGGSYAHVPTAGFAQQTLRAALGAAPKAKRKGEVQQLFRPLYAWPLGVAFLAFLASWWMPLARSRRRWWQGASAAALAPLWVQWALLGLSSGYLSACNTEGPDATDDGNTAAASGDEDIRSADEGREALADARRHLLAGRYTEAVASYEAEAARYGSDARFQLNLGLAHLALGNAEAAGNALHAALAAADSDDIKADAFYNLGRLLLAAGDAQEESGASGKHSFAEAADAFRDALRHRLPDARSAHNLQVALAKLSAAKETDSESESSESEPAESDKSDTQDGEPDKDEPGSEQRDGSESEDEDTSDTRDAEGNAPEESDRQDSAGDPKAGEDAPEDNARTAGDAPPQDPSEDASGSTEDEQAQHARSGEEDPTRDAGDAPETHSAEEGTDESGTEEAQALGRDNAAPSDDERNASREDIPVMLRALDALQQGEGSFYKEQARQDARRRRLPQTSQDW